MSIVIQLVLAWIKKYVGSISPKMWLIIGIVCLVAANFLYIKSLRSDVQERDATIISLNAEVEKLTIERKTLRSQIDKQNASIDAWKTRGQQLQTALDTVMHLFTEKNAEYEKLVAKILSEAVPQDCTGALLWQSLHMRDIETRWLVPYTAPATSGVSN